MNPWDITGLVAGWLMLVFVCFTLIMVLVIIIGVLAAFIGGWRNRKNPEYRPLRAMPKPPARD